MAWPTSTAATNTSDNAADKISGARSAINQTISNVNNIIGTFNIPENPIDNYILRYNSSTSKFEVEALPAGAGGGITAVVDDVNPKLGGNLDLNGFSIITDSSDEDIVLAPNGQGRVIIDNSTGSDRLQVSQVIPKTGSAFFIHTLANDSDPVSTSPGPFISFGVDNETTPTKILIGHGLPVQVEVESDSDYEFTCPVKIQDNLIIRNATVSTLGSANRPGAIAFCTDETDGAVLVFADGTNWRRSTDRAIAT